MRKRIFTLITVTMLAMMILSAASFGAFNGYALRFNNQGTLDKFALTKTTLTLKDGYASFTSTGHDPNAAYTFGENDALNADTYKFMAVKYRTNCKHANTIGEMYFASDSSGYDPNKTRITFNLNTENVWTTAIIDLSGKADWAGNIKSLRIDYLEGPELPADQNMDIAYIAVFTTKAEAEAFNGDFGSENPATGDSSIVFVVLVFVALSVSVLRKKFTF